MIVIFILLFSISAFATDEVKTALDLAQKQKWTQAIEVASHTNKSELLKIILSQKYLDQKSDATFEEIIKFLTRNPHWPHFDEMLLCAEKKIDKKTPAALVKKWFDKHSPITPNGHKFIAYAEIAEYKKSQNHDKKSVIETVKNGWINAEFDSKEQQYYLRRYRKIISKEDHAKKVNLLLWRGNILGAKKILSLLHPSHKKIFLSRIASMENLKDAARIYANLNEAEKYHSGVLYEYINHKIQQDPKTDVTKLILQAPNDLENSEKWWKLKSAIIRELIENKNYKHAYLIASKHYSVKKEDKIDALWMSGWIAFSFLHKSDIAAKYFERYFQNATKPNTISKAAYWSAKSLASSKNNKQMAYKWLAKAAAFPETFYGQLANEYIKKKTIHLKITPKIEAKYRAKFENNDLIKALHLLQRYKKYELAQNYMKSAINHSNHPAEVLLITQIAKDGEIHVGNHQNPQYLLPKNRVEPSLVYAIIKQESAFNPSAISNKNAQGLMQLKPGTAKDIARELKIEYSESRLTSDVVYNLNLGTKYLQNLIEQFDNSYILALCAYNAGPAKAREWIKRFGDPREMKSMHDIINWIELIPYAQTRDYVQKIMENLQIYRYIFKDQKAFKIKKDLYVKTPV